MIVSFCAADVELIVYPSCRMLLRPRPLSGRGPPSPRCRRAGSRHPAGSCSSSHAPGTSSHASSVTGGRELRERRRRKAAFGTTQLRRMVRRSLRPGARLMRERRRRRHWRRRLIRSHVLADGAIELGRLVVLCIAFRAAAVLQASVVLAWIELRSRVTHVDRHAMRWWRWRGLIFVGVRASTLLS